MTTSPPLTVIFDGTCGFCTRIVRLLSARDRDSRISWVPCQQIANDEAIIGDCMESVISITDEGVTDTGAQAFARIMTVIMGTEWPVRIASLPGVRHLMAIGYHLIARNRDHLPGDVPWCDQYPDDCQPRAS